MLMVYGILPISHIYEYNAASLIDTENEHAPYIMALDLANGTTNVRLEDSFVQSIVAAIYEAIFKSDSLLSHQWANDFLDESEKFKPDFVVFVTHGSDRYDLAVSEVKSPVNRSGNPVESDLVKIGKEMAWMVNALVNKGVPDPVVGGILLDGYKMKIFKMDIKYPKTYRMIELSSMVLFDNLQGISTLPAILANTMQLKNVIMKTAIKAKKCAVEKSEGLHSDLTPPRSYLAQSQYNLRANRAKK